MITIIYGIISMLITKTSINDTYYTNVELIKYTDDFIKIYDNNTYFEHINTYIDDIKTNIIDPINNFTIEECINSVNNISDKFNKTFIIDVFSILQNFTGYNLTLLIHDLKNINSTFSYMNNIDINGILMECTDSFDDINNIINITNLFDINTLNLSSIANINFNLSYINDIITVLELYGGVCNSNCQFNSSNILSQLNNIDIDIDINIDLNALNMISTFSGLLDINVQTIIDNNKPDIAQYIDYIYNAHEYVNKLLTYSTIFLGIGIIILFIIIILICSIYILTVICIRLELLLHVVNLCYIIIILLLCFPLILSMLSIFTYDTYLNQENIGNNFLNNGVPQIVDINQRMNMMGVNVTLENYIMEIGINVDLYNVSLPTLNSQIDIKKLILNYITNCKYNNEEYKLKNTFDNYVYNISNFVQTFDINVIIPNVTFSRQTNELLSNISSSFLANTLIYTNDIYDLIKCNRLNNFKLLPLIYSYMQTFSIYLLGIVFFQLTLSIYIIINLCTLIFARLCLYKMTIRSMK
jgi:hypothetical protein